MPSIIDPPKGHPQPLVTGIYIARGDDTLGPYDSAEAAALVLGGYLHANDHAARNGDAAWVPLAEFLPAELPFHAEPLPGPEPVSTATAREAHPHRWRRLTVVCAVFLAVPLAVVVGAHRWKSHRATPGQTEIRPPATPAAALPSPTPPVVLVAEPPAPSPTATPAAGPVRGSVSLVLPEGSRNLVAGVRVTAYPLALLETALAPTVAAARTARERLDPQIEDADAERTERAADEQSALQAWHDAAPSDPMRSSLRFAYTGARTATRTAGDNSRYLREARAAAAGGEIFFRALPEPAVAAETDAGGNFVLDLPTDDTAYVVAACVRAAVDDGAVPPRFWLVKLSPAQRAGREPLRLDVGNLTSSPAEASLVRTSD